MKRKSVFKLCFVAELLGRGFFHSLVSHSLTEIMDGFTAIWTFTEPLSLETEEPEHSASQLHYFVCSSSP